MAGFRMFTALTGAFLSLAPAQAQDFTAAETAQVDAIVRDALASSGVPSASVAVVRDGRIAFAKAFGTQSPDMKMARADAPYQIASISKQFTAAALLILEDQGKLSLDDKIAKFIPGISGGDRIAIRQLLDHTSGLRDYWPQDFSFAAMAKPTTPQGIVDIWANAPLDFEPGTQWQYSNTGYVVAGMIVEKVSGMSLIAFLDREIFKPLGIKAMDQDLAVGKGFPAGYKRHALGPVRVETPAAHGWLYAAGELAMSASELAKWDIARMNRALLPDDDWAAQETETRLVDGEGTGYGLGVSLGEMRGRRMVEHSGEAVGFLSENIVFPEEKDAVVVLVNAWFGNAQGEIARGIADMLYPQVAKADETALARKVYEQLRNGTLDRSLLTANADYFFTTEALTDYRTSLAPLGEPTTFVALGQPRARGGFVGRSYLLTFPDRKLRISTFVEPGDGGKIEQFLVYPAS